MDSSTDLELDFLSQSIDLSEEELDNSLREIDHDILILSKENAVYKYILEKSLNNVEKIGANSEPEKEANFDLLKLTEKCYFAKEYLTDLKKKLENTNVRSIKELKELKFKQDFLNTKLSNVKEMVDNFDKNVIEKHPVTKKIKLQKIVNYFHDSIKCKNAMISRYKLQIECFTLDGNKLLNQIKDHEKRLASLDHTEYQEMKYKHQKICNELQQNKERFSFCKYKYSTISLNVTEMKETFKEHQHKLSAIKKSVSRKNNVKNLILSRKSLNDQKIKELNEAMHKIKLDPRRHNLPEVIDYVAVKRENENLKLGIAFWEKKVSAAKMLLKAQQKSWQPCIRKNL